MKKIKIFIIYFLLIAYSVETLLFFFIKEKTFTTEDIKKARVEIAKAKGLEYDLRTRKEAVLDLKKNNDDLEPVFYYSPIFRFSNTFKNAKKNNKTIPFRGPIDKKSMTCAEDLNYKLVKNDKYGFKNSNSIYKKEINTMLLGDSFAEGLCQDSKNDIAGHLTNYGFITLNLGVAGTSSLVSLGILREFRDLIKPKNVVYLYYEANDLEGLNWEKKDNHLISYLNSEYKIDYISKYKQINDFLKKSSNESLKNLKNTKKKDTEKKGRLDLLKNNIVDILELSKTKDIIRYSLLKKKRIDYDMRLFVSVIKKMEQDAYELGANYIFVYVPSSYRYISEHEFSNKKYEEYMSLKSEILKNLDANNINIVDLTDFFDKTKNIEQYYPLGYFGHFNSKGYKKVAEIISEKLD